MRTLKQVTSYTPPPPQSHVALIFCTLAANSSAMQFALEYDTAHSPVPHLDVAVLIGVK